MVLLSSNIKSLKLADALLILFFTIAFAEVVAEFFSLKILIYILKPILNPLLIIIYLLTSVVKNTNFIFALFFAFVANLFFISTDFSSILLGNCFFLIFKLLVIYLVIKAVKVKNYLPILIGTIPFMFLFLYITSLTIDELGDQFYMYLVQVICICFLGGFTLSNYIIDSTKMNFYIMNSALLSTVIQFVFILKMYFLPVFIFQPMAMFLYVFSQFALYKFVLLSEKSEIK